MESKASTAIVGLFVLLLTVAMVASLLWLLGAGRGPTVMYTVHMKESVSGLTQDAVVKYRGVDVGRVADIEIASDDPEIVTLTLAIQPGVPVREDTRATLEFQGFTGLAYINLIGGSREAPKLTVRPGEEFPVIESAPSILARFDTGLSELIANLNETTKQLSGALDGVDQATIARTLGNLERLSGTLAARSEEIDAATRDAARLFENAARSSDRFPALVDSLEHLAKDWRDAGREVEQLASAGRREIERTSGQVSGDVQLLAQDVRQLVARLDRVVAELELDPSAVLYGRGDETAGPGE
jgi:phospholipid/cholesterol/gamma-HCH transport system substrate-binding protein